MQWDCTIKAMNGKEFFLMEVIAIILRHLKHKVLEYEGRGMTGILNVTDFEWVITVPAIWRAKGKQMMREAAYKVNNIFRKALKYTTLLHPSKTIMSVIVSLHITSIYSELELQCLSHHNYRKKACDCGMGQTQFAFENRLCLHFPDTV